MVEQVKRVEQEFTPIPNFSSCTSMSGELQQHQHYDHSWCPTPPRDGSISSGNSTHRRDSDTINFSPHGFNKGSYHRSESPSFLPLSPPSVSCNKSTSTLDYDDDDRYNEEDQQQGRRDHSPQAPSTAGSTTATLPPYNSPTKYDQTIRGYELWTHKDDILLLQHVLSRLQLGNWRELEAKFEGRHTARLCDARWKYLRDQLLKGIQNASTSC
ncbi:uncharacterized protein BX664DRAFT_332494 [Halteromyces radiatus]|uniref:uncharacterized protein n=1 Tax=Halteromyces radiatus TaxID=101107 RepID=UPI0022212643|nr:uncharacterized protein BX664DRAFT_332494 [Halteromyces radiatus]KAI8089236.1 hypothetical protein BX664DRAFT_332494 [Halteromyces radiatus]